MVTILMSNIITDVHEAKYNNHVYITFYVMIPIEKNPMQKCDKVIYFAASQLKVRPELSCSSHVFFFSFNLE